MFADTAPELIPFADDDACACAIDDLARIDAELQRVEADKSEALQAAATTGGSGAKKGMGELIVTPMSNSAVLPIFGRG